VGKLKPLYLRDKSGSGGGNGGREKDQDLWKIRRGPLRSRNEGRRDLQGEGTASQDLSKKGRKGRGSGLIQRGGEDKEA